MKKDILIGVLFLAAVAGVVSGAPRSDVSVARTSRNEGDTRSGISITCSSTTWTQAAAARPYRRAVVLQTLASSFNVCLTTITTSGQNCVDSAPGYELAANSSVSDYSEAAIYCRARTGSTGEIVKGMDYYDSADGTGQ